MREYRGLCAKIVSCIALMMVQSGASAQDAAHGKVVFEDQCAGCHTVEPNVNQNGPSLFAVLGKPAGSNTTFPYSAALIQSGLVWTDGALDRFIRAADTIVPGTTMGGRVDDIQARADVIAYLKTLH